MDPKINLAPTDSAEKTPLGGESAPEKTNSLNLTPQNTETPKFSAPSLSTPIDFSSQENLSSSPVNPIDSGLKPGIESGEEKKKNSSSFLSTLLVILLIIIVSLASGISVYIWQSSASRTSRADTAKLQSQIGNLKSQVEVLEKDKSSLQAEVDRMTREAKNNADLNSQTTPEIQPGSPAGEPLQPSVENRPTGNETPSAPVTPPVPNSNINP